MTVAAADRAGAAADDGPSDARVLMLAAKPGDRLFRVLENPAPLRPLLAALAVLPAVLASPRCRLDRVDPEWGAACLAAVRGLPLWEVGPAAWLTGRALEAVGTVGPMPYFALGWAGTTLLVWAVWQLTAAASGGRPAAFAALLVATNPVTAAAAASGPPAVAGVAAAVVAAWLWVRAGREGVMWLAAAGGVAAGLAVLLAGPFAGLIPAAVPAAEFLMKLRPAAADVPRRDRWPQTLRRFGLYAAGAAVTLAPAAAVSGGPVWTADKLDGRGLWLLVGPAAAGAVAALGGQLWLGSPLRRTAVGVTAAVAAWAGLTGAGLWGPGGPDAGTLTALVAGAVAGAVALEGACRPAVSARAVAFLAALPVIGLLGAWLWAGSAASVAWRAAFLAVAAFALWGVWEVVAFRWSKEVRGRRLLIVAVVALAAAGLHWAVRGTRAAAGRGTRQLVATLADRREDAVFVLADPADQPAARFLFSAAFRGRVRGTFGGDRPRMAELLNRELAKDPPPLIAFVGPGPLAALDQLRPAGASPAAAGVLRGGDGQWKEVRLLARPPRDADDTQ